MILTSLLVLAIVGAIAALVLFGVTKKFHVDEDPRIDEVEALLAGANCGGCGRSGCRDFATACVKADTLEGLYCPSGGQATMDKIADIVGLKPVATTPKVAVVRCDGSCSNRQHYNHYDGERSCAIEASLYIGETECSYGCLGCGDCVSVCPYDAIHMDPESGLPVVDFEKCVGCGRCVKACPRGIIALVPNTGDKAIYYVACMNHDKGGVAMKECNAACIGCMKCQKVCPTGAATVAVFLASIDPEKCTACGLCEEACPRNTITHCLTPKEAATTTES